jgi:phosphoenolpyruvate carboxylase
MEGEPVIQRSIQLRNPYVDPLNYIQVEMLRRLRVPDPDGPEAAALRGHRGYDQWHCSRIEEYRVI